MKIFNRKLKITSSALLTLCMVFVMTACAENSSQSEKSQPAEQTTVQPTTMSAEEINDRKLDKFISDMTLEEKVGQMFLYAAPMKTLCNRSASTISAVTSCLAEILTVKPKMKLLTIFTAIRTRRIFRF